MKYLSILFFFCFAYVNTFSQCNTDVTICTPGEAGPFTFVNASQQVGTCQSFLNGINSPNYGYILLYISESGPLSLLIDGNSNSGYIDVSIFNIPDGEDPCTAITNNSNEIGCNFASNMSGCNQFGTYFPCASSVPPPYVNQGDVIMIVVEDYSSQQNNFTIELGPAPNAQTGSLDAEILPLEAFNEDDPPMAIEAVVGGGTWTSDCGACIDEETGVFDPSVAGIGTWEVCYDIGEAPCEDSDCETIVVQPAIGNCGDLSSDTGGNTGNYGNNQNYTYTFCSDEISQNVALIFSEFDLEPQNDFIEIFQGPNTTYQSLGVFTGTNSPEVVTSDNGCLTFVFTSNESVTSLGWSAEFSCVPPCQQIEYDFSTSGDYSLSQNGEILLCIENELTIEAEGIYPENNTYYEQSDLTSVFEWNLGDSTTLFGNEISHTYLEAGTYLIDLTITDQINCVLESTPLTVVVSSPLNFTGTTVTNETICLGEDNTLTGNFIIESPNPLISFESAGWASDPTIVTTTDNTITVLPTAVGEQCYTYQVSNSLGCEYDTTICFMVSPLEDASFSLTDFCVNASNQASSILVAGGAFSFDETILDGAIINNLTGEISNGIAGNTYNVLYITAGTCPNSSVESVTVLSLDNASFDYEDFCINTPTSPTNIITPGGVFSFGTMPSDGAIIDSTTGIISLGSIGNTYDVQYSTASTCPNSSSLSVTISDEVVIDEIEETCALNQTEYAVSFTLEEGDLASLSVGIGGTLVGNTFTSDFIPSGESYSFSVTDSNGCNTIIVEGEKTCYCLASAALAGSIEICEGDQGTIDLTLTGDSPWEVSYALDGAPQPSVTTATPNFALPVTSAGSYTLLSVSDQYCVGSVSGSAEVSYLEAPTASLNGNYTICSNATQNLEVDVTGTNEWELNYSINGVPQATIISENSPIVIEGNIAGTYELIAISDQNCTTTSNDVATINHFTPIEITIDANEDICIGTSTNLLGIASGEGGSNYNYTWYEAGNNISSSASLQVSPLETTNYELVVDSDCGINYTEDITIQVHPYPEVTFELEPSLLCIDENTTAIVTNTTADISQGNCTWEINNQQYTSCSQLQHTFDEPGYYTVGLTVESVHGCSSTLVQPNFIAVYPSPVPSFTFTPEDPTVFDNFITFENTSEGAISYSWELGDAGTSIEENPSQAFYANDQGFYNYNICLTAINEMGCQQTFCSPLALEVELLVYVPTAFTPNGDLVNDIFKPVVTGNDPDVYEFSIYNIWGEKIFSTKDERKGWNGAYHGIYNTDKEQDKYYVQEEVYSWKLELKKEASADIKIYTGKVTVIR